jgi:hypothetical protein
MPCFGSVLLSIPPAANVIWAVPAKVALQNNADACARAALLTMVVMALVPTLANYDMMLFLVRARLTMVLLNITMTLWLIKLNNVNHLLHLTHGHLKWL